METQTSIQLEETLKHNYKRLDDGKFASLFYHISDEINGFDFSVINDKTKTYEISIFQHKVKSVEGKNQILFRFKIQKNDKILIDATKFEDYIISFDLDGIIKRAYREVNKKSMSYKFVADMQRLVNLLNGDAA